MPAYRTSWLVPVSISAEIRLSARPIRVHEGLVRRYRKALHGCRDPGPLQIGRNAVQTFVAAGDVQNVAVRGDLIDCRRPSVIGERITSESVERVRPRLAVVDALRQCRVKR